MDGLNCALLVITFDRPTASGSLELIPISEKDRPDNIICGCRYGDFITVLDELTNLFAKRAEEWKRGD